VDDGKIVPGTRSAGSIDPCANGPQLTDQSGDAVDVVGTETPLPSEPQLDIRSLLLSTKPSDTVEFKLTVQDLKSAAEVPSGSPGGVYYDMNFTYGGHALYITATRDATGVTKFLLGSLSPTRKTWATLTGSFDETANTITALLTPANIATARAAMTTYNADPANAASKVVVVPPLTAGATFSALSVTARRNTGAAVPDIDSASSNCTFTLGAPHPDVPEVPYPVLLLLSAMAVAGVTVEVGRRRRRGAA
jgi:hypothetical protein